MKRFAYVLAGAAFLLAGCPPGGRAIDTAADEAVLEAKGVEWEELFNAGDAAGIAALYGENAMLYPPNMPPVEGRAGIQDLFQEFIDTGASIELAYEETGVDGDLGYRIGAWALTGSDGEGIDNGHFLEIWSRVNGEWMFERDIWNSDRPLPEPEAEVEAESEDSDDAD